MDLATAYMDKASQPSSMSAPSRWLCALLAAWIFILSLAGVSPAMHAWLHADADCAHTCDPHTDQETPASKDTDTSGHYCGVVALQGAIAPTVALVLPERTDFEQIHFSSRSERLTSQKPQRCLRARAPPIEIIV